MSLWNNFIPTSWLWIYIRALKWKLRQLSVHFGVLWSKHVHHNLLFYCVTVEKYLNLQNAKRNTGRRSLVHKCRNQDCVHCTVKGFTSRDLCTSLSIAATKTVDCSFIKAEHSTQVSSKNKSRKNTCIAKQFAVPPPVSQSFDSICHLLTNHKFLHIYCLKRSVLPSTNTVFESCKTTTSLLLFLNFCFRVLFYRINTHALKNAFQLQNNSKFIWLAGILFSNLIIQALPKI
jgi:hypothetical protein